MGWGSPVSGTYAPIQRQYSDGGQAIVRDMIDINGDGLPDYVDSEGSASGWSVYYNTGRGFTSSVEIPLPTSLSGIISISIRWNGANAVFSRVVDFNGDGLPDVLRSLHYGNRCTNGPGQDCYPEYDSRCSGHVYPGSQGAYMAQCLEVYFNEGDRFSLEPKLIRMPMEGFLSHDVGDAAFDRNITRDFLDVNGDGLPDYVMEYSACSNAPSIKCNGSGQCPGDGTCDKQWRVLLNTGGDLEPTQWRNSEYPDFPVAFNAYAFAKWPGGSGMLRADTRSGQSNFGQLEMLDINGDGFLDRVEVELNASGSPTGKWKVQLARQLQLPDARTTIPRPYLMATMSNEMGGVNSIFYERSTMYDHTGDDGGQHMPFVQWLVKATRLNDGRCSPGPWANVLDPASNPCIEDANGVGHEVIRKYFYSGGYLAVEDDGANMTEREFRGFRRAVSSDLSGGIVETYFHQDWARKGRIEAQKTWAMSPSWQLALVAEETNTWTAHAHWHGASRTLIYLSHNRKARYDLGATHPQVVTTENFVVDGYGRVRRSAVYGEEIGGVVDFVHYHTNYAEPPGGADFRPYDKPSEAWTQAGEAGPVLERRWFYYDGATSGSSVGNGNLTRIVTWNDGGPDPVTEMVYDGYGNLRLVFDPNGNPTLTSYDDGHGTFIWPLTVMRFKTPSNWLPPTNPYTWVTVHDYKTGNIALEWGPGGAIGAMGLPDNITARAFDAAGRTVCEALPGDGVGGGGSNCTLRTEYEFADGSPGSLSTVTVSEKWDSNSNRRTARSFFDALGRSVRTEVDAVVGANPSPTTVVRDDVEYGRDGRLLRRYYPYRKDLFHRANGAVEFDYRLNGSAFQDPLRRVWKSSYPDGSSVRTEFHGLDTYAFDAMNVKTVSTADTFSRVKRTQVFAAGAGTPYSVNESDYDALGRVVGVWQNGIQIKQIAYDSLGRKRQVSDRNSGQSATALGHWKYYYDPLCQ